MFDSNPASLDLSILSSKAESRLQLTEIAGALVSDYRSDGPFSFSLQGAYSSGRQLEVSNSISSFAASLDRSRDLNSGFWNDRSPQSTSWGMGQPEATRELVFIDQGVENWKGLLADIRGQQRDGRSIEVVTLDGDRDGMQQITEALQGFQNLTAVHVISHGVEGGLRLGNSMLTSRNLSAYAGDLTGWRDSLSDQADIMLYGCNLAAGLDGKSFVDGIAALTGADVAASSDLTGATGLGGNWTLEYQIGNISSDVALSTLGQFDWEAILAGTINIDQTWLASQGAGPYVLKDADTTYVLQTDVNVGGTAFYVAQRNITFDLNQHTISYGAASQDNKWGVCLYINWHNTEIVISGAAEPTGFTLKNGSIVSTGTGSRSHGVYGHRGQNSILQDLYVDSGGKDSQSVFFRYENATIKDSQLVARTNSTFNRHSGPANVTVGGALQATGNFLLGGNSGFNVGSNSVISKNIISHSGFATNGYGVWLYRNNNVHVSDNIIIPSNGRGILANAGTNHLFERNVILHLEAPNLEFGSSLNPPAIRTRYDANNIVYQNNTSLGIGGGALTSASSIYLSNDGSGINRFTGNNASVILIGQPTGLKYAQPLTMEYQGNVTPSKDIIEGNSFNSNHLMIRTSGYDGYAKQDRAIKNNSYVWRDGDSASTNFGQSLAVKLEELRPFLSSSVYSASSDLLNLTISRIQGLVAGVGLQDSKAFWYGKYASFSDPQGSYATVLNSTFGPGVDPSTVSYSTLNSGQVSLGEGKSVQIQFLNGGNPVVNSTMSVVSNRGDTYVLQTNGAGLAEVQFLNFSLEKADAANSSFGLVSRVSSTITFDGFSPIQIQHSNVPQTIEIGNKREDYILQYQGDGLVVYGTEYVNSVLWSQNNSLQFTIDGFLFDIMQPINWLEFRGKGAVDSIQLVGSNGSDTLLAQSGDYSFTMENGFRVFAKEFEFLDAIAATGANDVAFLYDTVGDDVFTSSPNSATLEGAGYRYVASDFDRVTANSSSSTTRDIAHFYGTAGSDTFLATTTFASMTSGSVVNRANGFDKAIGYSDSGLDTAYLYDGAGIDQLTGSLTAIQMTGNGFENSANGFYRTFVYGTPGTGQDVLEISAITASSVILNPLQTILRWGINSLTATGFYEQSILGSAASTADVRLYGSSGSDILTADPSQATMTGTNYRHRASGFTRVRSFAGLGGIDVTTLSDSTGDDTFSANSTWAQMKGTGFQNEAYGFGQTSGISSTSSIKDIAILSGTAGTETMNASPDSVQLTGVAFSNQANGFDFTYSLSNGGSDTASFQDSNGKDTLVGDLTYARLYGPGYNHYAGGFGTVNAFATTGGDVLSLVDSVGNDQVTIGVGLLSLIGSNKTLTATGFVTQQVRSIRGGTDTVNFNVGGGDNLMVMREEFSALSGTGYYNRADGFRNVYGNATGTSGYNRVALYGSTGVDQMRFEQNYGRCDRGSWLRRFEGFNLAYAYVGGEDDVVVNNPEYTLILIG